MTRASSRPWEQRSQLLISITIFLVMTGLMGGLRLYVYDHRFITLTYGLPLLICLWHRDLRLLWSMAAAFSLMATFKAFVLLPNAAAPDTWDPLQWLFQLINIFIIAGAVHAIIRLTEALRAENAALEEANNELQAQAEELAQQNQEIQQQSEELTRQGEELQQQMEEMERQNEELQVQGEELTAQSEELQASNAELNDREMMLQTLLRTATVAGAGQTMLEEICKTMFPLLGPGIRCAAIVDRQGDDLVVHAHSGLTPAESGRRPYHNTLVSIVIEHGRTACVHDLAERPDLGAPRCWGLAMRSGIAAPIHMDNEIAGVLEVYSAEPRAWTTRQFQLIEWAAMQSGLVLQIHNLREGLERLVKERTARLQELINELEHFSYSITHDMRAPLRAMQGFGEILVKECTGLSERQTEYLGHIIESAARLDRLITDALSYTKTVQSELRLGRVDTHRLIEGIVRSYPNIQGTNALVDIQGELPPVLGNEAALTQCFSNLLDNAIKFVPTDRRPHVVIRSERLDGQVRLWVEDNGIGIAPEFLPYLFQMFRRASLDYNGTGIGLALVKKTCEKMGGQVGVCSEPGQGSRFWVLLQAAPTETVSETSALR